MAVFTDGIQSDGSGGGGGGSGAPTDAKYVTVQAESGLSAEVNLGALTSGLLKHTVSGGVSTPATAVAGTDYRAVDDDVISRQTLGADAQEITITVDGNTDERVLIEGFGESNAGGNLLLKYNSTTVDVTKIISANGGAPTGSSANGIGSSVADEAIGFTLELDLRATGTADRGGICRVWIGYGASSEEYYTSGVCFHDSSTNVTSIVLSGSVANFFGTGFKVICRRRKMSV